MVETGTENEKPHGEGNDDQSTAPTCACQCSEKPANEIETEDTPATTINTSQKQKEAKIIKILNKRGKLRRFFGRIEKKWVSWAGFRADARYATPNPEPEKKLPKTFGVPGFDEIACIEVDVPDIMSTDMDKIRTTCKECLIHPPEFPSKDQIKAKLIAADKYFGVRGSPNWDGNQEELEHEADYFDDDGSVVHPSWRFILERPLVEQYVLMNNYIRKYSAQQELESGSRRRKFIEEPQPLNDKLIEDFTRKHKKDTEQLLESMKEPKTMDSSVQTKIRLEDDMTKIMSQVSLYPNSDLSTSTKRSHDASIDSFLMRKDGSSGSGVQNSKMGKWWESTDPQQPSETVPTSCESAMKPNSESGSDGLSVPLHFAQARTSLAANRGDKKNAGIISKVHKRQLFKQSPRGLKKGTKKVTFSPHIKYFQNPTKNLPLFAIPVGIVSDRKSHEQARVEGKAIENSDRNNFESQDGGNVKYEKAAGKDDELHQLHYKIAKAGTSPNSSLEETETSTSNERITLRPSPGGFFKPGEAYESIRENIVQPQASNRIEAAKSNATVGKINFHAEKTGTRVENANEISSRLEMKQMYALPLRQIKYRYSTAERDSKAILDPTGETGERKLSEIGNEIKAKFPRIESWLAQKEGKSSNSKDEIANRDIFPKATRPEENYLEDRRNEENAPKRISKSYEKTLQEIEVKLSTDNRRRQTMPNFQLGAFRDAASLRNDVSRSVDELKKYFEKSPSPKKDASIKSTKQQNNSPLAKENEPQEKLASQWHLAVQKSYIAELKDFKKNKSSTSVESKESYAKLETPKISNVNVLVQSRVFSSNSLFAPSSDRTHFKPPTSHKQRDAARGQIAVTMAAPFEADEPPRNEKTDDQEMQKEENVSSESKLAIHKPHNTVLPYFILGSIMLQPEQTGVQMMEEKLQIASPEEENESSSMKTGSVFSKCSVQYESDFTFKVSSKSRDSKRSSTSDVYRKWLTNNVPATLKNSNLLLETCEDMEGPSRLSQIGPAVGNSLSTGGKLVFELRKKDAAKSGNVGTDTDENEFLSVEK